MLRAESSASLDDYLGTAVHALVRSRSPSIVEDASRPASPMRPSSPARLSSFTSRPTLSAPAPTGSVTRAPSVDECADELAGAGVTDPVGAGAGADAGDAMPLSLECADDAEAARALVLTRKEADDVAGAVAVNGVALDGGVPLRALYLAELARLRVTDAEKDAVRRTLQIAFNRHLVSARVYDVPRADLDIVHERRESLWTGDVALRAGSKTWHISAWLTHGEGIVCKMHRETVSALFGAATFKYALIADASKFAAAATPRNEAAREIDTLRERVRALERAATVADDEAAALRRTLAATAERAAHDAAEALKRARDVEALGEKIDILVAENNRLNDLLATASK
jgi:hypothetical protein